MIRALLKKLAKVRRNVSRISSPPHCRPAPDGFPQAPDIALLEDRVLYSASPIPIDLVDGTVDQADASAEHAFFSKHLFTDAWPDDAATADVADVQNKDLNHERLDTSHQAVTAAPPSQTSDVRHELVVLDPSAEDHEQMLRDILEQTDDGRHLEVLVLDPERNGVEQITEALDRYGHLDALHIVSHGTEGAVKLGDEWLGLNNLDRYAGSIARWGTVFNADADVLFYGCELAGTANGEALVEVIAELTGADVAASTDDTGHESLGGDWELEFHDGAIETQLAFSTDVQQQWLGLLSATAAVDVDKVNETQNGDEQTTINATPKAIASDGSGNFVAVWECDKQDGSNWGIYASRFDASGNPIDSPLTPPGNPEFLVNSTTTGNQINPAVAMNDSGQFVAVFQTKDAPGSDKFDIYAVLYDDAGNLVKSEFLVNAAWQPEDQTDPSVAMRDDGSFIVTWTSRDQDGDKEGIFAQMFDAAGNASGGIMQVNNIAPKEQFYSSVATNSAGDFIVTWSTKRLVDNRLSIAARRFDSSGAPLGKQFTVDQFDGTDQHYSDVALADDGSFIIAWQSDGQDDGNSSGIYARRYGTDGNAIGNEFLVNQSTPTADEGAPSVSIDASGNFVIAWTTDGAEVYSREFDALGNPTTAGDIHVTSLAGDQFGGAVTVTDSGDYIVLFSGEGPGDANGVFAQRYAVPALPVVDLNGGVAGTGFSVAFVEDGGAVLIADPAATITDADSTQLDKLSVVITNALDGAGETLNADTSGTSLTANYLNGVLTISGPGPTDLAEFVTVLRTVQYDNTSQSPTTTDRQIRFVAQDTSLFSGPSAFTTVTVHAINDQPVITAPATDTTDEDVPLVFSPVGGNAISISDDAGENPIEVTLTATNGTITVTNRLGGETRINLAEAEDQKEPAVAVAADGRYVVVWHAKNGLDKDDVYARTYNADGTAISGDIVVANNTAKDQRNADVAIDDNGNFVVVWEHDTENINDKWDIYARTFDINGNPLGGNEIRVNKDKLNDQLAPAVAMDNDGTFVVAWQSKTALDGKEIYIRSFDLELNDLVNDDILVNSTPDSDQTAPDVAIRSDGQFVVVWQSKNQDGDGEGIYLKRFDAGYAAIDGSDVLVNFAHTDDHQKAPAVAVNDNGQIVVAWQSEKQDDPDNSDGVYAQRFDFATGAAVGGEIAVNTETADDQSTPDVAIGEDGKFVVVWQSHGQEADDISQGVYLQEFNADGTKLRFEEPVNTETFKDQAAPAVAMRHSSQYVVVWQSQDQDTTNDDGIYAQRFLRPGALDFTAGDGVNDVTTTFTGRVVDINQALDGMVFTPDQDFNGMASLQIDVDDLGNTGTGGAEQDSHTIAITVNAVNDTPVISSPQSTQEVKENQPFTFDINSSNAISLSDVDAAGDDLQVTLSVGFGILNIDTGTGVTITGGANGSGSVTFTGTQDQLNDALDGLIYTPNLSYLGPDTLNVTVDDQGNNGSGGPEVAANSVSINVFDYNIPPVNSFPASVSTPENTTFLFSGGNQIEVIDNDATATDNIDVRLTVTHGLLQLSSDPGISITGNWSAGDTTLILDGDKDLVNAALAGLQFVPDTNYAGPAYLQIITNDQGNSGIDGDKSDLDIVEINVTPDAVNDAPTVSGPAAAVTDEESPITFSSATSTAIQVNDDADGNPIRVTVTAADGTVSLSNTAGTQFQVNTTTDKHQRDAAVAMSVTGDFVVVWESENQDGDGYGIYAQRYDASGFPVDSEFKVNATTHRHQTDPAVAMADDGNFVVTWVSEEQDGDNKGIFVQRYDANGQRAGSEIQVNTYTTKAQQAPDVAMDATGRFVIVWESDDQDGDDWGIYGQVFDNTGAKVGSEFRANFATAKDQINASVAMDADGDFVVAWQSKQPGNDKWDIQARRFNPDGTAKDPADVTVNSVVDEQQERPDVAMDAAGNFVVTWQSKDLDYPDGKFGIYHRGFHANGTPVTAQQVLVNTHVTNEQQAPSVAMDRDGEYVISWQSKRQDDPDQAEKFGVFAQRYNADGTKRDGEFQVNTTTDKSQQAPAAAIGDNGRFVIVWESESEDGNEYGVFAQRYKDVSNLTFLQGDGTNDAQMQFEGTIDEINDALDGLVYTPAIDFDFDTNGLTSLQIDVDDLGHTGSGGSLTGSRTVDITVNAVNDAPTFALPSPQTAYEEVPLVFSSANGNLISVGDVDAANDPIQLGLTAYGGKLSLAVTTGLTFTTGDGTDDTTMTFSGTLADTNAALDGISYTAPAGFAGQGNIQLSANDLGNNGAGGDGTNNGVVVINVEQDFVNDPPQINVPGPQQTAKNVPLRIGDLNGNQVTIEDDALDSPIRVQLTVTNGTVTLTNTAGSETLVNSQTTDEQRFSNIATTPNGDFIAVWQSKNQDGSGEGIFAQRFNAAGSKIGSEFQVNQFTAGNQTAPVIAVADSGEFAIAWVSDGQDGNGLGIFARKYDSAGNPLGDETLVNTGVIGDQEMPSIAMDAGGAFVVTWQGVGDGDDIYAQRFDANGVAQGLEIIVNTSTAGNQEEPAVAMDAAGNFVIAWTADDANGKGVFAQRFDSEGNPIGIPEFQANTIEDSGDEQLPAISMNASGQFVIAWQGDDANNDGIRATFYDTDGSVISEDFIVNENQVGNQRQPSVAVNDNGQFVVSWYTGPGGNEDIAARMFDAAGLPTGGEFAVNSTTGNSQTDASVAIDADGSPLITWTSAGDQDGDKTGVFLQRVIPDGAVTFHAGTGINDAFVDVEGRPDFINGLLNNMIFTPTNNFKGEAKIDIHVDDQGYTGSGGPLIDDDTVVIMVEFPFLDLDADDSSGADGAGYLAHFTPGGAAVNLVDADKLIVTPENELKSVTITLTNRPDGANETLAVDASSYPAISSSPYNPATGVITLTGQTSKLSYATVLNSLTYYNAAGTPDETPRIIEIQFRDRSNDDSNIATATVLIDMQPPLLDVTGELDYVVGDPPTPIVNFANVTDPDTANFAGGKLTIDMASSGSIDDRLAIRNEGTGAGQISIAGADVQYDFGGGPVTVGTFAQPGPYDGLSTIEINLNATSDATSVAAVIKNVTFENVSASPETHLRAVRFVLDDGEGGISETASATIRVTALASSAPTLASVEIGPLAYTENAGAVAVTSTLTLSDADDTQMETATIQITGNYVTGQDLLEFADTANITGSWVSGTGTLTLSGPASLAEFETALRNVTYRNISENPATATRTISFSAFDGDATSNVVTRDIAVTPVNDPPVLSSIEVPALAYAENDGPVAITSSILVGDQDDANIESATVAITGNYEIGEDLLAFADTANISGSWDSLTGVLTLTGTDTRANYRAALVGVTYENTSENPNPATRTVGFTVNDGNDDSNTQYRDINVTPVNDDPVITSGSSAIVAENTTFVQTVTSTDVDGGVPFYSISGGADGGSFTINSTSGNLAFFAAPDFETPADANLDNVYEVEVTVDDGNLGNDVQLISVTVTDVVEGSILVVDTTADYDSADARYGNTSSIGALLADKGSDNLISLREAIEATNNTANAGAPDEIHFNIADNDAGHVYYRDDGIAGSLSLVASTTLDDGSIGDFDPDYPYAAHSWLSIDLDNALPQLVINDAVIINGYTQPGAAQNTLSVGNDAQLRIELNSSGPDGNRGLTFDGSVDGSKVQGLAINGFSFAGILTESGADGVTIQGNFLGTDITGTTDQGNGDGGVHLRSSNNLVGGPNPADRNVISGNDSRGVITYTTGPIETNNVVENNYIGVDATGLNALANNTAGIQVWNQNGMQIRDNVISGNIGPGVWYRFGSTNSNTIVQGNRIGVGADGVTAMANSGAGILIESAGSTSTIGGTLPGEANSIAYNAGNGVEIRFGGDGHAIRGNSILANGGLGIDLNGDGVTPNDLLPGDPDLGANNNQNFPVLTSATTDGATSITISGTINTSAFTDIDIDFYYSLSQDPTGHGEGQFYLGSTSVTTSAFGNAAFTNVTLPGTVPAGAFVTATATVAAGPEAGNTSEFASNIAAILVNSPPVAVNDSASVNEGAAATIDLAANDSDADDGLDLTSITIVSGPTNGSLVVNPDGTVDYTHDGSETASDSFTYTIDDNSGATSNLATVNLTINSVNDAPVISPPTGTLNYNENSGAKKLAPSAAANDGDSTDFDGGTLTVDFSAGGTGNDRLSILESGSISLVSSDVFDGGIQIGSFTGGTDGFTPLVVTLNANANAATTTNLLQNIAYENDSDDPAATSRTVRFVLTDGDGGTSAAKTVDVNFSAINDAPALDLDADNSSGATGADFDTTFIEGAGTVAIADPADAALNDVDDVNLVSLTVTITNLLDGPSELLTADTSGTAITATFSGGVLTLTGSDSEAHYQQVLRTITYNNTAPSPNTTTRTIEFVANDGADDSNLAIAHVVIVPQNSPPVASDDAASVDEGATVNIDLAGNDTDADGIDLAGIQVVSGPAHGSLVVNLDGTVDYAHDGSETTGDSFAYTIDDNLGSTSSVATVVITIQPTNDVPVAVDDQFTLVAEDTIHVAAPGLVANDSDADGDALSVTLVSGPANGTLSLNADGSFSYTPNPGYVGNDRFTYQVDDGSGTGGTATVKFAILVAPDVPLSDPGPDSQPPDNEPPVDEREETPPPELYHSPQIDPPDDDDPRPQAATTPQRGEPVPIQRPAVFDFELARQTIAVDESIVDEVIEKKESRPMFTEQADAVRLADADPIPTAVLDAFALAGDLDELGKLIDTSLGLQPLTVGAVVTASSLLTAGYVFWTIRGGFLVSSLLAQMPAWRLVDPLPVLSYLDGDRKKNDEDADRGDSLEEIIEGSGGALGLA